MTMCIRQISSLQCQDLSITEISSCLSLQCLICGSWQVLLRLGFLSNFFSTFCCILNSVLTLTSFSAVYSQLFLSLPFKQISGETLKQNPTLSPIIVADFSDYEQCSAFIILKNPNRDGFASVTPGKKLATSGFAHASAPSKFPHKRPFSQGFCPFLKDFAPDKSQLKDIIDSTHEKLSSESGYSKSPSQLIKHREDNLALVEVSYNRLLSIQVI
ncbi:transmembrane protein, putative [Medicago truncatula]|uniref:Transmembrane protein, putative n=1 Tax=Medicago truncatula TaxID=3880 RepID=A0A072U2Y6_MEDTR|nr:transmembrane protein, putative [Medicago truncatula]